MHEKQWREGEETDKKSTELNKIYTNTHTEIIIANTADFQHHDLYHCPNNNNHDNDEDDDASSSSSSSYCYVSKLSLTVPFLCYTDLMSKWFFSPSFSLVVKADTLN